MMGFQDDVYTLAQIQALIYQSGNNYWLMVVVLVVVVVVVLVLLLFQCVCVCMYVCMYVCVCVCVKSDRQMIELRSC